MKVYPLPMHIRTITYQCVNFLQIFARSTFEGWSIATEADQAFIIVVAGFRPKIRNGPEMVLCPQQRDVC